MIRATLITISALIVVVGGCRDDPPATAQMPRSENPDGAPTTPEANDGQLRRQFGRLRQTIQGCRQFIRSHEAKKAWCGKAQLEIARLLERQRNHPEAIRAYQEAIARYGGERIPDLSANMTVRETAMLHMGLCHATAGDRDEAMGVLQKLSQQGQNRNVRRSARIHYLRVKQQGHKLIGKLTAVDDRLDSSSPFTVTVELSNPSNVVLTFHLFAAIRREPIYPGCGATNADGGDLTLQPHESLTKKLTFSSKTLLGLEQGVTRVHAVTEGVALECKPLKLHVIWRPLTQQQAKQLFVEVERIARLAKAEQAKHVQHLYRDVFPVAELHRYSLTILGRPEMPADRATLTPEALADQILSHGEGRGWLVEYARATCLGLLGHNLQLLEALIKADFQSRDESARKRALRIVGRLRLSRFFEDVLEVFQKDRNLSERAAYTLRDIGDPRAIPYLVRQQPGTTLPAFELLRSLQRGRPADTTLVELLRSHDPGVRWRAAYALAESGDASLLPHIKRLARDQHPKVRKYAANMGFCMKHEVFMRIRPTVVSLLSDPNLEVKCFVARCFAQRKDKVCARTLLELAKDTSIDQLQHSNIIQAIHSLTGSYFGYHIGSDAWRPTSENNKKAIEEFGRWIQKQAAPDKTQRRQ